MAKDGFLSGITVLDPIERGSEVLFGLIMVLTFTGSFRATGADHDDVHRMLLAALGCNLAWGIIDAVMYLISVRSQRGHNLLLLRHVRAAEPDRGRRLISDAMSDDLAAVLTEAEVEAIRQRFVKLPETTNHFLLRFSDYRAAFHVFVLVFVSTFPVVLPFVFIRNAGLALRVSNLVAIIMLFLTGFAYGKYAGSHPWRDGFWMVLLGLAMVGLTMLFGG
jgi:VIT1/CCC1 family predicted Fe2+/Mn2+ transporter